MGQHTYLDATTRFEVHRGRSVPSTQHSERQPRRVGRSCSRCEVVGNHSLTSWGSTAAADQSTPSPSRTHVCDRQDPAMAQTAAAKKSSHRHSIQHATARSRSGGASSPMTLDGTARHSQSIVGSLCRNTVKSLPCSSRSLAVSSPKNSAPRSVMEALTCSDRYSSREIRNAPFIPAPSAPRWLDGNPWPTSRSPASPGRAYRSHAAASPGRYQLYARPTR